MGSYIRRWPGPRSSCLGSRQLSLVSLWFYFLSLKDSCGEGTRSRHTQQPCIFFIVVNEFCERFSYYGMRAVLVLYFKYFLQWDDDFATTIYHTFVALCYLTPILGAIVADSWLGKFKTIVYLSLVYTLGQIIMAISAIHDITDHNKDGTPDDMTLHIALSMVGLLLIALGTGGIKPCVAAFGGDQFEDHQEKQRSTFFSIFYLSINAGSLLSTIITPILRAQECGIHKKMQCYPLAFGVPAALMVVALIVFIVGSGMYNKTAPQGNIIVKVCRCIGFAIKNRSRHRSSQHPKREHWMDWADEKYDKLLIAQVKMVLKVLFLYIPLPMFWALFDQQGSRWTLQATTLNGNFGFMTIQPDQMQTVNPILILVLVPIMDSVIYPLIAKCKLNFSPLKRMTVGMFLAALAFIAAALVQIQIDGTLPTFPSSSESQAKFINMVDRKLDIKAGINDVPLEPYMVLQCCLESPSRTTCQLMVMFHRESKTDVCEHVTFSSAVRNVLVLTGVFSCYTSAKFSIKGAGPGQECFFEQQFGFGSSYTMIIKPNFTFGADCQNSIQPVMDMSPNTVHMAWQIPQYFLMTAGEVVFSVTGLEFSYSQAPSNMKSVLQAGWLLTVAVGNIIVLIISEAATLDDQWAEYILFASLLVLVCIIFAVMAYFYTYMDPAKIEAQFAERKPEELEPDEKDRKKSLEMTKKDAVENHKEDRRSSRGSSSDEEEVQTKI
uniref:Solute carrier family 15 member 1 n=1 Tax=Sparus aurata TaxID=8175 RepID=A0A671Z0W4_SPAAU